MNNKNNNKHLLIGAIMLSIGIMSGAAISVSADTSAPSKTNKENHRFFNKFHGKKSKHNKNPEIIQAIENSDYQTWKEIINKRPRITDIIDTEEKFNKLVEAHNLMKDGKFKEAKTIKESLGLTHHNKLQKRHNNTSN